MSLIIFFIQLKENLILGTFIKTKLYLNSTNDNILFIFLEHWLFRWQLHFKKGTCNELPYPFTVEERYTPWPRKAVHASITFWDAMPHFFSSILHEGARDFYSEFYQFATSSASCGVFRISNATK